MVKTSTRIKVYHYGNRIQLIIPSIPMRYRGAIKRCGGMEYIVLSTGEVKTMQSRGDKRQIQAMLHSMVKLRRILGENLYNTERENTVFLTLTYRENMQNMDKLYIDFKAFIRAARRRFAPQMEYIYIAEPQQRGAWHIHAILIDDKKLWLPQKKLMTECWTHGSVRVERLKDAKDIAAYLTTYFCYDVQSKNGKLTKKGSRLGRYPKGYRYYRCSRGIKQPTADIIQDSEILHDLQEQFKDVVRACVKTAHYTREDGSQGEIGYRYEERQG